MIHRRLTQNDTNVGIVVVLFCQIFYFFTLGWSAEIEDLIIS